MYAFTQTLTTGTLVVHIFLGVLVAFLVASLFLKGNTFVIFLKKELHKRSLFIAWTFSLLSTISPLVYSEVFNLEPCRLCWFQRIAMFPLLFILTAALIAKDRKGARRYALPLAISGACISLYHYALQRGALGGDSVSCGVVGQGVSCADMYIIEFGYITIPLMALTSFIVIIISLAKKNN